jgi:hypothetical protein
MLKDRTETCAADPLVPTPVSADIVTNEKATTAAAVATTISIANTNSITIKVATATTVDVAAAPITQKPSSQQPKEGPTTSATSKKKSTTSIYNSTASNGERTSIRGDDYPFVIRMQTSEQTALMQHGMLTDPVVVHDIDTYDSNASSTDGRQKLVVMAAMRGHPADDSSPSRWEAVGSKVQCEWTTLHAGDGEGSAAVGSRGGTEGNQQVLSDGAVEAFDSTSCEEGEGSKDYKDYEVAVIECAVPVEAVLAASGDGRLHVTVRLLSPTANKPQRRRKNRMRKLGGKKQKRNDQDDASAKVSSLKSPSEMEEGGVELKLEARRGELRLYR